MEERKKKRTQVRLPKRSVVPVRKRKAHEKRSFDGLLKQVAETEAKKRALRERRRGYIENSHELSLLGKKKILGESFPNHHRGPTSRPVKKRKRVPGRGGSNRVRKRVGTASARPLGGRENALGKGKAVRIWGKRGCNLSVVIRKLY